MWESRPSPRPTAPSPSHVSSPGRDSNEENLRADALKTIGKAGHQQQQRLHLDTAAASAGRRPSGSGSTPPNTPLVKEILEELPKDGVDPRNRMLLRNALQHRGNKR